MRRRPKKSARAAILTLIALLLIPAQGLAQTQTPGQDQVPASSPSIFSSAFDVVILRPLGVVVLAVGSAMFVPVAIVTAPGGKDNLEGALDFFVLGPYNDVFTRPLGEF
jgi:hypothetical protein